MGGDPQRAFLVLPPCLLLSSLHLASQHQVTEGQGSPQIPPPARRSCPVSLSGQHPDPSQVFFSRYLPAHSGCHLDLGVLQCLPPGSFESCQAAGLSLSCLGWTKGPHAQFPSPHLEISSVSQSPATLTLQLIQGQFRLTSPRLQINQVFIFSGLIPPV